MNSRLHDARAPGRSFAPIGEDRGGVTDPASGAAPPELGGEPTDVAAAGVGGLPLVLTVEELAALLRTNRKTVYESVRLGEIPGVRRIGRSIRIHRDAVLRWLAEGQGRVSRRRGAG